MVQTEVEEGGGVNGREQQLQKKATGWWKVEGPPWVDMNGVAHC